MLYRDGSQASANVAFSLWASLILNHVGTAREDVDRKDRIRFREHLRIQAAATTSVNLFNLKALF